MDRKSPVPAQSMSEIRELFMRKYILTATLYLAAATPDAPGEAQGTVQSFRWRTFRS